MHFATTRYCSYLLTFFLVLGIALWSLAANCEGSPEELLSAPGSTLKDETSGISETIKDVSGHLRSKTSPLAQYIEELTTVPTKLNDFLNHPTNDELKARGLLLFFQTALCLFLVFLVELIFSRVFRSVSPPHIFKTRLIAFARYLMVKPVLFFVLSMLSFSVFKAFSSVWLFLFHFSLGLLGLRVFLRVLSYCLKEMKEYHPRLHQLMDLITPVFFGCYLTIFTQSYLVFLGIDNPLFSLIFICFSLIVIALLVKLLVVFHSSFMDDNPIEDLSAMKINISLLSSKKFWGILIFMAASTYLVWVYTSFTHLLYIKFLTSGLILSLALAVIIALRFLLQVICQPNSLMFTFFPNFSRQFSKSLSILRFIMTIVLGTVALILASHIWGVHFIEWSNDVFHVNIINVLIDITILIFIGLVLTDLIETSFIHYVNYITGRHKSAGISIPQSAKWLNTLLPLFQKAIRILLTIIFFLIIISQLGIDITPFLAGLSLLGLAISFGSQTYIKNIIAGLNILFSGSLSVKDLVEIGKFKGKVESLSLRAVELRDLDTGAVHIIPFGDVAEITNYTREYNFCSFELNIPSSVNLDKLSQVIQAVLDSMNQELYYKDLILGPPEIWGVKSMDNMGICVQCRFKVSPYCTKRMKPAFLERLNRALIAHKIPLSAPVETFLAFLSEPRPGAQ